MGKEPEDNKGEGRQDRRFDQWQYDFLKRCSEKGEEGVEEWNEWRSIHPREAILLEGQQFFKAYPETEDLCKADPAGGVLHSRDGRYGRIKGLYLAGINLAGAFLDDAKFIGADLRNAMLIGGHLRGADFTGAHLEGSNFNGADLRSARFSHAVVDGSTAFWHCTVDRYEREWVGTDFSGVGLEHIQADPGTRQQFSYNVRRKNWEGWYRQHRFLQWPVWLFWVTSDYGLRTWRIIASFFMLALVFALIYWIWPCCLQGIRSGHDWRSFVHAIYFSIVTMTTLGFGDIAASADSWQGQVLLMTQVILGYVLLGALVTRFAVLFTAGGPAGRFAESESVTSDK